jgi:gliding motility-associated-like protein
VHGINNEFKPVISFADFDNYQMIIYNRWGDEIFKSNDITIGWDGRVGGKIVQEGQYMYYISVADGFGSLIERRGAVLMLVGKD